MSQAQHRNALYTLYLNMYHQNYKEALTLRKIKIMQLAHTVNDMNGIMSV